MRNRFDFVLKYINDTAILASPYDKYIILRLSYTESREPYIICSTDGKTWCAPDAQWVRRLDHVEHGTCKDYVAAQKVMRRKYGYDIVSSELTEDFTHIYTFRKRSTKELLVIEAEDIWPINVLKNYLNRKENK